MENQQRDKNLNANEWWLNFGKDVNVFKFLFVSSYFKGNFESNLEYSSNRTGVDGGAINVENLLYLAEELKSGRLAYRDLFYSYKNNEISEKEILAQSNSYGIEKL